MLKLILIGWIAGIALMGHNLAFINATWWIWLVLAILIFAIGFYKKRQSAVRQPLSIFLILISSSWALFCAGYHFADQALQQRLQFRETQTQPFEAIIYIKKIDELSDNGHKQIAEVLNRYDQPVNWFLYLKKNKDQFDLSSPLKLGSYYKVYGTIKPAHSYAVSGAFDQEKWFLQQNVMSAFSVKQIELLSDDEVYRLGYQQHLKQQQSITAKFLLNVEMMRLSFRLKLQTSNYQNKGLMLALLTGDESLLSDEIKQQFQLLGISHLLAISGPHVLIFALMLTWLLQKVIQRYCPQLYLWQPRQIVLLFPFIGCVLLYVAFVGFEIPALRTLLTVCIVGFFLLVRQSIRPFALLVYSASLLLIFDPFSILSAAFWLSYGACFILLRIYQTIAKLPQDQPMTYVQKGYFAIKLLVESQWKIFVALLPLVLIFFQQISLFPPLTNLIAIPFLSMIVIPLDILAACLSSIIPILETLLFYINDVCLSILLWILSFLQQASPALYGVSCTPLMMVSLIVGLIILFLPHGTFPKAWSLIGFLPILLGFKAQPTVLNILDVGQGQAIFLQHPEQTLMIDTGGSYDETKFSIGERVVIPFLRQQGIRELNHVMLSHLDQDHSGAFPKIQNAFAIEQVQSNEYRSTMQFKDNFSLCQQGQQWTYTNLKIEVLSPRTEDLALASSQQNEQSCVIYLTFSNAQPYQHFLIMGDAGWETEYKLLQQYPDLKVDVLVLGHHGSKHSSAYDFLAILRPKLAIASAGFDNRYGHPSLELQQRLKALNIPLFTTVNAGTISFIFDQGQVQLKQQRQQVKWLQRK
ncbi:MAG TPA: DNA internalization-related competence protein ComEC/Rec2 [Acinetobacter venetianus]|uniref:DNA internalization-related competence protein ComEC/Rec2 n=1 Tax=Acinetobacter venetianus TaxID=52133 RepID=UPI001A125396|nr:DNA internalization-related competence protein ComEC/Rec2 [Acinetobacter venetianus]HIQ35701.1 DNA internalization-related competence protein ComEC/Rec2 [Acinetobacter venetianus]